MGAEGYPVFSPGRPVQGMQVRPARPPAHGCLHGLDKRREPDCPGQSLSCSVTPAMTLLGGHSHLEHREPGRFRRAHDHQLGYAALTPSMPTIGSRVWCRVGGYRSPFTANIKVKSTT